VQFSTPKDIQHIGNALLNNSLLSLTPSIELLLASRIKDKSVSEQIIPFLFPSIFIELILNSKIFPSHPLTLLHDYLEDQDIPEELKSEFNDF
jgi:hypothetical protein